MSVLQTTIAEADARLHMVGYVNDGTLEPDTIVREWKHIDATHADTLIQGLEDDGTEADPKVDNQEYAGTWQIGQCKAIAEPGEKRWVTIRQWLYKANTVITNAGSKFRGETAAVGRRPATYTREWPNLTLASKNTLVGAADVVGVARSNFTNTDPTDHDALSAGTYTHLRCDVIPIPEKGLYTVRQTLTIPKGGGSGAVDAEPYKVKLVSDGTGNTWKVTEYRNYGLSLANALKYADADSPYDQFINPVIAGATTSCPGDWGGKNMASRNLGSVIKEDNGSTWTGVQVTWLDTDNFN